MKNFYDDSVNEFLKRLDDIIRRTRRTYQEQLTDFLDPFFCKIAEDYLKKENDLHILTFGGVKGAERKRLLICPEFVQPEEKMFNIGIIRLEGNLEFIKVGHRDFLGALLGQGIRREKLGDIFVNDTGCVAVITEELTQYILLNPPRIKKIPFTASLIPIGHWQPPEPEGKIIKSTLVSLRLDAVVAHGFGLSRSQVSKEISKGKVKVNWQEILNRDYQCKEDDIISFRGKGRLNVLEIGGQTKKGRIKVILKRFK